MVSVAGRGALRGSVAVWITQVPGRLLSPARRPLVPGLEGQSLRQERGGCAWAERPGAGDAGGASGRAVQQLLRPLFHTLRCGGQGQDLMPILMASAVSAAERDQETMAEASRGEGHREEWPDPRGAGSLPSPPASVARWLPGWWAPCSRPCLLRPLCVSASSYKDTSHTGSRATALHSRHPQGPVSEQVPIPRAPGTRTGTTQPLGDTAELRTEGREGLQQWQQFLMSESGSHPALSTQGPHSHPRSPSRPCPPPLSRLMLPVVSEWPTDRPRPSPPRPRPQSELRPLGSLQGPVACRGHPDAFRCRGLCTS